MRRFLLACALLIFIPIQVWAAGDNYYVSLAGTRTSGVSTVDDWSNANCYGTVIAAIAQMSGGDIVTVNDGLYTGYDNVIGRHTDVPVPSGSSGAWTIIRARNPFAVVLDSGQSAPWDYYGAMVWLDGVSYIHVDGFRGINRDGDNANFVSVINSPYIKITRCQLRTEGAARSENTVVLIRGDNTHDILIEDVAVTGGYRYGFGLIGWNSGPYNIIFRRCVGRGDWVQSGQPYSMFAVYGYNQGGDYPADSGPRNIAYQNCVALDENDHTGVTAATKSSPIYWFNGWSGDNYIIGSIFMNNIIATGETSNIKQDYPSSTAVSLTYKNNLHYGNIGASTYQPLHFQGVNDAGSTNTITGNTFGNQTNAFRYSERDAEVISGGHNNLFVDLDSASVVNNLFDSMQYNCFDVVGQVFGTDRVTYNNDLTYLPRVNSTSNRRSGGLSGAHVGAHILYKHGVSGTLMFEDGWNTETTELLWPWPYDAEITEWFAVENNPPAGAYPATNDTTRGMVAAGGITNYVWTALGSPVPLDFEDGEPPAGDTTPPTVTITTSGPVTSTDGTAVIEFTDSDDTGVTSRKWHIGSAPDATHGTECTSPATITGLSVGSNTVYIGAGDAAGNWGSDSITVNYSPVASSTIIINSGIRGGGGVR